MQSSNRKPGALRIAPASQPEWIPLSDATGCTALHVPRATLWRWARHGVSKGGRVRKLPTRRIKGRLHTTCFHLREYIINVIL